MILRLNGNTRIDNLRNYPSGIVEKLRVLLSAGAAAYPDPHRDAFYDVENGSRAFYIHLCPNGKVWLLASWQKPAPVLAENPAQFAVAPR
jgi:streptogramin lyase